MRPVLAVEVQPGTSGHTEPRANRILFLSEQCWDRVREVEHRNVLSVVLVVLDGCTEHPSVITVLARKRHFGERRNVSVPLGNASELMSMCLAHR